MSPAARSRKWRTGSTMFRRPTPRSAISFSKTRRKAQNTEGQGMPSPIKAALAGAGAFGLKHLDGIKLIDGVEVISLVGRELDKTREAAAKYGVGHVTTDLAESLKLPGLDAVILATPTQMHAAQALQCLEAGKHVQV